MKVSTSACRWSFRRMSSLRNRSSQNRMNSSVTLGFASFSSAREQFLVPVGDKSIRMVADDRSYVFAAIGAGLMSPLRHSALLIVPDQLRR